MLNLAILWTLKSIIVWIKKTTLQNKLVVDRGKYLKNIIVTIKF